MSLTARLMTACSLLLCLQPLTAAAKPSASETPPARQEGSAASEPGRSANRAPREAVPIPGVVVVKLLPSTEKVIGYGPPRTASAFGLSSLDATLRRYNVLRIERAFPTKTEPPTRPLPDLSKIYKLYLPRDTDADRLVETLNQNPYVEYAERVYMAYTNVVPDDPRYLDGSQLYFQRISAAGAWDVQTGADTIVVAIIDTGTDWDHVDLRENIWQNLGEDFDEDGHTIEFDGSNWILDPGDINTVDDDDYDDNPDTFIDDLIGWDFVDVPDWWPDEFQPAPGEDGTDPDNDPDDFAGHGTHTAGIASAVTNNTIGVAGIGWNTTIMPVRVGYATADGTGSIPWGYEGIVYAVDNGADIVSLSWGGGGASQMGKDVIDNAWGLGTIIVASAGNDGSTAPNYPAAYDHVLSVGWTSAVTDKVNSLSNYGSSVDVYAPGSSILSTLPNDAYGKNSGTSMSAPMVAGAVALLKAQHPADTPHELLMRLAANADNIDAANTDKAGLLGYGRLNVLAALTGPATTPGPNLAMTPTFADGDGDGIAEPGETVELTITLENQFLGGPASNVSLTLSSTDYAVTLLNTQATISGTIDPLASIAAAPFTFVIAATAIPHRAVFTLEVTADGYAETITFSTPIGRAGVLLVDDDDGGNNVESYYFDSLDSLGMPFDYWSHIDQGAGPPAAIMGDYPTVIWFTEWAFPALDGADRTAIGTYLSGGGNLFLSGQDIGWDLADDAGHEFLESGGASRVWYEANLHARYLADDATPGGQAAITVTGVAGDPIGQGLSFDITQPGRPPEFQFPSVIEPLTGAQPSFQYPDGGTGATLWEGVYKVVNMAFGYEAITDDSARFVVLDRVLNWFNDFSIDHQPLTDTENTVDDRIVTVAVESGGAAIDSMAIYWSLDGTVPFNIVTMVEGLPGVYSGAIPAHGENTTVHYFIFALTSTNFFQTSPRGAPLADHTYFVGTDVIPPVIAALTPGKTTIDNSGVYSIAAGITDNGTVAPGSVYLHYALNEAAFDSLLMAGNPLTAQFAGTINFGTPLSDGDTLRYFVSASDEAAAANRTVSAVEERVIVSRLLVDDFESGVEDWIISDGWERFPWGHTGTYSITDSPTGNGQYSLNREYILENRHSYNLAARQSAYLTFWHIYVLGGGDSVFVELSNDGSSWTTEQFFVGSNNYNWDSVTVSLADYVGLDDVRFRFRLVSDGESLGDGWYLDDITFLVDTALVLTVVEPQDGLPARYALMQNYPNPFNPTTIIEYHLPRADDVSLMVYNIRGQVVRSLLKGRRPAGIHTSTLNVSGMASGIYFYRLEATGFSQTRKMLILK